MENGLPKPAITDDRVTKTKLKKIGKSVRDMFACQGVILQWTDEECYNWLLSQAAQMRSSFNGRKIRQTIRLVNGLEDFVFNCPMPADRHGIFIITLEQERIVKWKFYAEFRLARNRFEILRGRFRDRGSIILSADRMIVVEFDELGKIYDEDEE